ncbi:hypothetical protein Pint_05918 [Pistacia integerrima]|uniref:Uncharacterized protein n=1 Tax=Pistacia integerrima TaxID=434235 RepID=A0ACC0Z092_9ROSI|nr:hypothetical protein Pint_05918 [Pistacia integerrima]
MGVKKILDRKSKWHESNPCEMWSWNEPNGTTSHNHIIPDYLVFGSFNVPEGNETSNSLGRAGFRYEKFLSESVEPNTDIETAWFNSTQEWFEVATKLEGLELDQTYNGTTLPKVPPLVIGLNGSTADLFLDNKAYRNFIYKEFNASSHDMESSAIAMVISLISELFGGVNGVYGGGEAFGGSDGGDGDEFEGEGGLVGGLANGGGGGEFVGVNTGGSEGELLGGLDTSSGGGDELVGGLDAIGGGGGAGRDELVDGLEIGGCVGGDGVEGVERSD